MRPGRNGVPGRTRPAHASLLPCSRSPSVRKSRMHRAKSYPDNRQEFSGEAGAPVQTKRPLVREEPAEFWTFSRSLFQTGRTMCMTGWQGKEEPIPVGTTSLCTTRTSVRVGLARIFASFSPSTCPSLLHHWRPRCFRSANVSTHSEAPGEPFHPGAFPPLAQRQRGEPRQLAAGRRAVQAPPPRTRCGAQV